MPDTMATAARGFTVPNTASLFQHLARTVSTPAVTYTCAAIEGVTAAVSAVATAPGHTTTLLEPAPPAMTAILHDAATNIFDTATRHGFAEAGLSHFEPAIIGLFYSTLAGGAIVATGKLMTRLIAVAPHGQPTDTWRRKICTRAQRVTDVGEDRRKSSPSTSTGQGRVGTREGGATREDVTGAGAARRSRTTDSGGAGGARRSATVDVGLCNHRRS
jgi:hypothetical protein